jgi:hypothetical protein
MEKQHGGGGFLAGLLIGAAVGALVSTQKGRQILKDLSDYGLEYVENAINLDDIETILNEDTEEMSNGEVKSEPVSEGYEPGSAESSEEARETPKKKRLFRGIRKK